MCHDDPFATSERRFLVPKPVDLAAEDGREVAMAATHQGLQSMPLLAEIYPVGGERPWLRSLQISWEICPVGGKGQPGMLAGSGEGSELGACGAAPFVTRALASEPRS